jgi:carbon-monoxide dehydrogenase medium subunit
VYYHPNELSTTFALMRQYEGEARLLAGGTDLLVRLKSGRMTPKAVIDIKGIRELNAGIERQGAEITLGSLTLMADVESHPLVRELFPALSESAHMVGSVQIRNRATIAGNLCNASPAADTAPALLIYNARVVCASSSGERILPLVEFILGPGKTALQKDELVQAIVLPLPPQGQASVFTRLTRRKGVDLATINLCCQVHTSGLTRFVLGAVGPTPIFVEEPDGILASTTVSLEEKKACLERLMQKAAPISDVRASKEYRQAMLTVLGLRAVTAALQQLYPQP